METKDANKANVDRFLKEFNDWYDETREAPEVAVEWDPTGPAGGNVPAGDGGLNVDRFVGISLTPQTLGHPTPSSSQAQA
jgi:hypothetical protein